MVDLIKTLCNVSIQYILGLSLYRCMENEYFLWLPDIPGHGVWLYPLAYVPRSRLKTVTVFGLLSSTMSFSLIPSQSRVGYRTPATGWCFQQLSPIYVAIIPRFTPALISGLSVQTLGELHSIREDRDAVRFLTSH